MSAEYLVNIEYNPYKVLFKWSYEVIAKDPSMLKDLVLTGKRGPYHDMRKNFAMSKAAAQRKAKKKITQHQHLLAEQSRAKEEYFSFTVKPDNVQLVERDAKADHLERIKNETRGDSVPSLQREKVWASLGGYSHREKTPMSHVNRQAEKEEPNLYTSRVLNSDGTVNPELHAPVLDFDYPIKLIPSRTPGHFHLYIDKHVPWEKYKNLLKAMAEAGIIEGGYADASIRAGFSAVRIPPAESAVDAAKEQIRQGIDLFDVVIPPTDPDEPDPIDPNLLF